MRYDELTNRLGKYLLGDKRRHRPPLIDPYEHGKLINGTPKPINIKWTIEDKRAGKPSKMSRTHLAQHLTKIPATDDKPTGYLETYYYRSNRAAPGLAFLKLDIDSHGGEADAHAQAQTIEREYLPGAYFEPSTKGRGRHLYALIEFNQYTNRRKVNQSLKMAVYALRELMKERGFKSTLDVRCAKTFSEASKDEHGNRHLSMGQLCKIPRPTNLDDIKRLEESPVFRPSHFKKMVQDFKVLRSSKKARPITETETVDPPVDQQAVEILRIKCNQFKGMDPTDPRSRAVHSVLSLSRRLGRLPDIQEARIFYESSGLATVRPSGDTPADIHRRLRRLSGAIEYAGRTFDPAKLGSGLNVETILPLIREHVKPEHKSGTKYQNKITDDDLAICLWVIEQASFERKEKRHQQWTCGNERIVQTFRKLKASRGSEEGTDDLGNNTCVSRKTKTAQNPQSERKKSVSAISGCNRNKAVALKTILITSGLAEIIDDSYRPGKHQRKVNDAAWDAIGIIGRSKRICVGVKHPRYAEFLRDFDLLADWVLTGTKPECHVVEPMGLPAAA